MKKVVFCGILLVFLSSAVQAIPMGGPGSRTRDMIKGTFIVEGTLEVNGLAKMNGQKYVWPKTAPKDGQQLVYSGKSLLSWQDEIAPGGIDGSVQLNKAGTFSGGNDLLWDGAKKNLLIGGTPVSLTGHTHDPADIKEIMGVANGGTGTDNGSILAAGELKLNAGGPSGNIFLLPSGAGIVTSPAPIRSETGFNVKGADGANGSITVVSDMKMNGTVLQKKTRSLTVTGGIITAIGAESDWVDVK